MKTNTHFRAHMKRNSLNTSISEQNLSQTELIKKKWNRVRTRYEWCYVHISLFVNLQFWKKIWAQLSFKSRLALFYAMLVIMSQATCPIIFEQCKEVLVSLSRRMLVHDREVTVFWKAGTVHCQQELSSQLKGCRKYSRRLALYVQGIIVSAVWPARYHITGRVIWRFNVACKMVLMYSARYFLSIVTKFGISRQIFMKIPNTKFHINPSSGSRADTCGQTDVLTAWYHITGRVIWRFNVSCNNKTYLGLHVKCPIFLPDFNKICILSTDFYDSPISNFHGNPSTGVRAATCGQTDGHYEGSRRFFASMRTT
jgi:hypothetical protein